MLKLEELVPELTGKALYDIRTEAPQPYLRYYRYAHEDGELILFFNEDPHQEIDTWVQVPSAGRSVCWYDAFDNVLRRAEICADRVRLKLSSYQGLVLCIGQTGEMAPEMESEGSVIGVAPEWKLVMQQAGHEEPFEEKRTELVNLASAGMYPEFSGTMIYETSFDLPENVRRIRVDLGEVYETAEILINGQTAGVRVAPPYTVIAEEELLKPGVNTLTVRVVNTLGHQQSRQDRYGMTLPQEPVGLLGPVELRAE